MINRVGMMNNPSFKGTVIVKPVAIKYDYLTGYNIRTAIKVHPRELRFQHQTGNIELFFPPGHKKEFLQMSEMELVQACRSRDWLVEHKRRESKSAFLARKEAVEAATSS